MENVIRRMASTDWPDVLDIFNYYIESSFAAYRQELVELADVERMMAAKQDYPAVVVENRQSRVTGFGLLSPHKPISSFFHCAEVTYFLLPEATGQGVGKYLLGQLEKSGREMGITTILACISSLNTRSLKFHAANGFEQCGRFKNVAKKNGVLFDTVWMQKDLDKGCEPACKSSTTL